MLACHLACCMHPPYGSYTGAPRRHLSTALMSVPSDQSGHMPMTSKPTVMVHVCHSVSRMLYASFLPAEGAQQQRQ